MSTGSTLVVFKQGLIAELAARPGLAGVQIEYAFPEETLQDEAIWFEGGEGSTSFPVMRAGTKPIEEQYSLTLAVQVLKTQGESQLTADLRVLEMLAEVQQCVAEKPQLIPDIMWCELESWNHVVGVLPSGSGHGSRFDARVQVRARLYP